MTIHDLNVFLTVAVEKSFVNAANKLYISQSAISQQIKKIEKELGFPLFFRSRHHVALTEQGEILMKTASEIVLNYNKAVNECVRSLSTNNSFSIAGIGETRNTLIPVILREFMRLFPDTEVHVSKIMPDQVVQFLSAGQFHMVLTPRYIVEDHSELSFISLYEDIHYCVVDRSNPLALRKELTNEDILSYKLLIPKQNNRPLHMQRALNEIKELSQQCSLETSENANDAISHLLYLPDRVALMPGYVCPVHPDLIRIPLKNEIRIRVGIAYRNDLSPQEKAFITVAQQVIQR